MFVMTVERPNLQLLKEFILNGRFNQNIYTCICKLSCTEVNIQDRGKEFLRGYAACDIKSPLNPGVK